MVLGDQTLPDRHTMFLLVGPKFIVKPVFEPVEMIALTSSISNCVLEEDRPRFITECIYVLCRTEGTRRNPQPVRECVEFAVSN